MDGDSNPDVWFNDLAQIRERLSKSKAPISDETAVEHIITKLPESYRPLVVGLKLSSTEYSVEDIQKEVRDFWNRSSRTISQTAKEASPSTANMENSKETVASVENTATRPPIVVEVDLELILESEEATTETKRKPRGTSNASNVRRKVTTPENVAVERLQNKRTERLLEVCLSECIAHPTSAENVLLPPTAPAPGRKVAG